MVCRAGKTEKLELNLALRSDVASLAGDRAACGDKRTCADIKSQVPNPSPSIGEGHTDWIMGEPKPISARNRSFESISLQRRVCKLSVPQRRSPIGAVAQARL